MNTDEQLGRIEAKQDIILELLRKHDDLLFGNGKAGLKDNVAMLLRAYGFWRWVWGTSFGAIISALAIGVVELILKGYIL